MKKITLMILLVIMSITAVAQSSADSGAKINERFYQAKVRELAGSMTYVELSNEPGYMDEFVSACFLPHTDSRLFPNSEVK